MEPAQTAARAASPTAERGSRLRSVRGSDAGSGDSDPSLLAAVLTALPDPAIALGPGARILEWSPAAERVLGTPRSKALGRELFALLGPAPARDALRAALADDAAGARREGGDPTAVSERLELDLETTAGGLTPFELTVGRAADDAPLILFLRDVSERRSREEADRVRVGRRERLVAFGQRVLAGADARELAADAVAWLRGELGVDTAQIWTPVDGREELVLFAADGWDAGEQIGGLTASPPALSPAPSGAVSPAPEEVPDAAFRPPAEVEMRGGAAIRFCVADGVHGVVAVSTGDPDGPGPAALDWIGPIGQLIGSAIGRNRADEQLASAERRYRDLIERLPVVTYLAEYGPEGRWLYVSPQIEDLLGYTPEEWVADRNLWWNCVHPEDRDRVLAEEERSAETLEPLSAEYRMIARDGGMVWVRDDGALGRPVGGGAVQVEGVLTDVTERKRAEEELRHRAEHDDLTSLLNRRRFEEELRTRRCDQGTSGALALLDIDSLKFVNDSLGHAAGDALIRGVAASLREALRPGELLARFGGDEFALLLVDGPEAELRERVTDLIRAVRNRDSRMPATISAGLVAFDSSEGITEEDLLVAADIAMHEAKEHGGDRVSVFKGEGGERLAWVEHVRAAIDSDRLLVHAQPIVDLRSGVSRGNELLVRMFDDDGAVLPPSAFLPTAERFGLIREIDAWMIDRAVEIVARGTSATVNLSARSIADPKLIEQIAAALKASGADPDMLVFEITETAAATAIDELRSFGAGVERLGCALAIDDFGTGFGSLTYLKHLPVRYLKIDMEFVRGLTKSASDRAIVHSIVTIAGSLGMRTVAEGVEDERTQEQLVSLGVDLAQGYYLGRPVLLELARE